MKVKFTTTLEDNILETAKTIAEKENRSVASIIEELLKEYFVKVAL